MAKVKKEKMSLEEMLEQALVKEEDRPYEVPGNWVWTKIKAISEVITGTTPSKNNLEYYGEKYPFFKPTDLEQGYNVIEAREYLSQLGVDKGRFIPKFSTLVTCIGATIGKCGFSRIDGSANQQINAMIPFKAVSQKYIFWLINSPFMQDSIISNASSTTLPILNKGRFQELYVPLPPITEQKHIVDLIESLFEKLDTAKELAQNALDSFEKRKAAIFHKAFTGELTAKWREANHLIPVKSILKDIEEERYNLQKNHSVNKSFSYKKSIQIEMQGRTKGIDKLFELPNTWDWVSLGQVTWNVSDGPHFSPNYVDKEVGVPIISARNVKYKNIDFSDAKYVSNEDYQEFIKRGKPEVGDILLTKGGTTGIPTTVDTDREFCIWVHIALLKIIKKYASSEYIRAVLASTILYSQSQEQTHGVGNQDLGLTRMIYMALPLPPLDEQKEIVRVLDNLLENEQTAKELCDVIEKIDLMKKSILARAFRGELGTNDPKEESAVELLKEVLKEKI